MFRRFPDDSPGDGGHLQMGFAAQIDVTTSREFKIAGAIGPCSSLKKMGPNVAETEIGSGGTSAWSMGGVDPSTTLAIYFEITNSNANPLPAHKRRYIQFVTQYQHANGTNFVSFRDRSASGAAERDGEGDAKANPRTGSASKTPT